MLPVDPVSLSLAYRSAHRATVMVPEEKLAYGFRKMPANAENIKPVPNIPEEKLVTFDSKVVELKDFPCRRYKTEVEEEEEEEEEESVKPDCGLGYLNYNQMGYYPQKHLNPEFAVTQFEAESDPERPCNQEPIQEIGNCGYRPGRIINHANRNDDINAYVISDDDLIRYEDLSS